MRRRALLTALALPSLTARSASVERGHALVFPRDHGAHPDARIEWWYATGWLAAPGTQQPRVGSGSAEAFGFGSAEAFGFGSAEAFGFGSAEAFGFGSAEAFGFQLTFFRSRTGVAPDQPSRFAARQIVFAHAALTDLGARRLRHDQRIARAGFGIAEAAEGDTRVLLRDWRLARSGPQERSVYRAQLASELAGFALDLELAITQPLLLQGEAGFSRKGPQPTQASHYYSQPQLAVHGTLALDGRARAVQGRAWLDHEWSDEILDAQALGWDWIGMNLADGTALTAFRLRRADGSALWAGGSLRRQGEAARSFAPDEVRFEPLEQWTSARSGVRYPIAWRVSTPAGVHVVRALLPDQELDSRASTGTIYWEGLSELRDAGGRRIGLGYLEMTGYAARLRL